MPRPPQKPSRMKGALVVSACVPVPELFKCSLQSHLTTSQSTALYRRFLLDIIETTQDVEGMDFFLAYSPRGSREKLSGLVPNQFKLICVDGRKTGERLSRIFSRLTRAGYERVVVLCTNHPDLPACMLHQAVSALERKKVDMVFGPNERGRYYLLGLKDDHPSLFSDIDWESDTVERELARWARSRRLKIHRLPHWYDINTVDDLRRHLTYYSLRQGSSKDFDSRTGRYLRKIQDRVLSLSC